MGYASDTSVPRTPPYTPRRPKHQFDPLSFPLPSAEPCGPGGTDNKRRPVIDDITVEELVEGDIGYVTDLDVVYPEELEEAETETESETAMSSSSEAEDPNDTGLLRRLSRLHCGDDSEVNFEKERRTRHLQKRAAAARVYKRPHSEIRNSGAETTDPEVLAGHDLVSSQRRLRRRTKGPDDIDMMDMARLAALGSAKGLPPHMWEKHGRNLTPGGSTVEEDDSDSDSDEDTDQNGRRGPTTPRRSTGHPMSYHSPAVHSGRGTRPAPAAMDIDF